MRRRDTYAAEAQVEHERRAKVLAEMGRPRPLRAIPIEEVMTADPFDVAALSAGLCPKCGKELPKRGAHFHLRACKA